MFDLLDKVDETIRWTGTTRYTRPGTVPKQGFHCPKIRVSLAPAKDLLCAGNGLWRVSCRTGARASRLPADGTGVRGPSAAPRRKVTAVPLCRHAGKRGRLRSGWRRKAPRINAARRIALRSGLPDRRLAYLYKARFSGRQSVVAKPPYLIRLRPARQASPQCNAASRESGRPPEAWNSDRVR